MPPTLIQAELLYKRDPQLKCQDVKILQQWLKKQPHLPTLEESQVIVFLHGCYYSIEATKSTIDAYFTRKSLHPEIFHCPSEDVIRSSMFCSFIKFLPKRTPEGYVIFLLKLLDFKAENYSFVNDVRIVNLVSNLELHQNGFANGLITILDAKGYTLSHSAKVNLAVLKHGLEHIQEGAPIRIKQVHVVNTVPFMDKILALVKPFLKKDLYNLIQLHSSVDTLFDYVPKDSLPEEYGGELPPCQVLQQENLKNVFDNLDVLQWYDSQEVDESKRMGKLSRDNSGFGMDGTFKKLEID